MVFALLSLPRGQLVVHLPRGGQEMIILTAPQRV